jgi:hypothetical protein
MAQLDSKQLRVALTRSRLQCSAANQWGGILIVFTFFMASDYLTNEAFYCE